MAAVAPPAGQTNFNEHPQPRTFAPSKEDVLQNLQYFFVRSQPLEPHAPWVLLLLRAHRLPFATSRAPPSRPRSSRTTRSTTCARLPSNIARAYHALTGFVLCLQAMTYHFPDAYAGQNTKMCALRPARA